MNEIESEKIFIIAATIVVLAFIATVTYNTRLSNIETQEKYNLCINKGGSWIQDNCLQRGSI